MKYSILISIFLLCYQVTFSQEYNLKIKEENKITREIRQAKFTSNNSILFSGLDSNIYEIDLNNLNISRTITGLFGKADFIEISDNNEVLAATSIDNEFTCWDLKSGKIKHTFGKYLPGYVQGHEIVFLPNNNQIVATGSCDFPLRDLENGNTIDTLKALPDECFYELAFTKDKNFYFAGGNYYIWKYDILNKNVEKKKNTKSISIILDIDWNENKKLLAVSGRSGLLLLDENLNTKFNLKGHKDWVNDVEFSKNGDLLYSCSGTMFGDDRSIKIWNTENGICDKTLLSHTNDINSIDISDDGSYLVSCSADNTMKLWSTKNQNLICTIIPVKKDNKVTLFIYTPDGLFFGSKNLLKIADIFKGDTQVKEKISISKKNKKKIIEKIMNLG